MPPSWISRAKFVAQYLSKKYVYSPEAGAACGARVVEVTGKLVARLKEQKKAGSPYYMGDSLTAMDVYGATVTTMFGALPPGQCDMDAGTRAAFEIRDAQTEAALDPILFEHRDMMYAKHLELPLSL